MITIKNVPEHITRDSYNALLESLGLSRPDLRKLEFYVDGVVVEVNARTPDGHLLVNRERNYPAIHRVWIPVIDHE